MADVPCMGWSEELSDDGKIRWHKWEAPRNMPIYMLLGPLWQFCHAWITYRIICRVVVAMTDQVTCGTISHVRQGCAQQMDTCDKHMDVLNTCNECMNCQNACDKCTNGSNPCMIHSNNQSNEHASNMNTHDDETT